MIPLHDDNPTELKPYATVAIIVVASLVFLWQQTLGPARQEETAYAFGLIPAVLFGKAQLPPEVAMIPPAVSIFTSMFLHGGWLHLIGNMLYLWIFGNNVEDAMGHGRFIAFYLLCGVAAALAEAFWEPGSAVPMIGASGAIAGVLGAYLLLYPHARVMVVLTLGVFSRIMWVPALAVLSLWIVFQLVQGALAPAGVGGIAYWAHIGGFAAGAVLILPFRRRGVTLFYPTHRRHPGGRGPWA
ncbi:MAG: rhomboid family intramembrane serine protease [Alphaproteobacteria bacterium]